MGLFIPCQGRPPLTLQRAGCQGYHALDLDVALVVANAIAWEARSAGCYSCTLMACRHIANSGILQGRSRRASEKECARPFNEESGSLFMTRWRLCGKSEVRTMIDTLCSKHVSVEE